MTEQQSNNIKTTYDEGTDPKLQDTLNRIQGRNARVRIWYGDIKTGRPWDEEYDVTGYIGRSTGRVKIPLLVHNRASLGGPALLTRCILRVVETKTGRVLYQHPNYKSPIYTIVMEDGKVDLPWAVYRQYGGLVARFKTYIKAKRWADFMEGKRFNK